MSLQFDHDSIKITIVSDMWLSKQESIFKNHTNNLKSLALGMIYKIKIRNRIKEICDKAFKQFEE